MEHAIDPLSANRGMTFQSVEAQIKELDSFDGFLDEFEQRCQSIKKGLFDLLQDLKIAGNPNDSAYFQLERKFQMAALGTKKRLQEKLRSMNRSALLHRRHVTQPSSTTNGPSDSSQVDSMAADVTASMNRTKQTLREEIDKAILSYQIMERSTKRLQATNKKQVELGSAGVLGRTRQAIKELWRRERADQFWITAAFGVFAAAALYVLSQRIWTPPVLVIVKSGWDLFMKNQKSILLEPAPVPFVETSFAETPSLLKEVDLEVTSSADPSLAERGFETLAEVSVGSASAQDNDFTETALPTASAPESAETATAAIEPSTTPEITQAPEESSSKPEVAEPTVSDSAQNEVATPIHSDKTTALAIHTEKILNIEPTDHAESHAIPSLDPNDNANGFTASTAVHPVEASESDVVTSDADKPEDQPFATESNTISHVDPASAVGFVVDSSQTISTPTVVTTINAEMPIETTLIDPPAVVETPSVVTFTTDFPPSFDITVDEISDLAESGAEIEGSSVPESSIEELVAAESDDENSKETSPEQQADDVVEPEETVQIPEKAEAEYKEPTMDPNSPVDQIVDDLREKQTEEDLHTEL